MDNKLLLWNMQFAKSWGFSSQQKTYWKMLFCWRNSSCWSSSTNSSVPKKCFFFFCACHQEIAVTSLLQTRETEAREPWGNMPMAVYSCITCHLFLLLSQAEQARKGPHSGMELGHVLGRQLPWPVQSLGPVEIPNLL